MKKHLPVAGSIVWMNWEWINKKIEQWMSIKHEILLGLTRTARVGIQGTKFLRTSAREIWVQASTRRCSWEISLDEKASSSARYLGVEVLLEEQPLISGNSFQDCALPDKHRKYKNYGSTLSSKFDKEIQFFGLRSY